ncbi:UDP-2,4-diacetamido-2,4,6-trideoxy-beta-L-altropy ranose hydrolase [Thiomicrorhabdus immobilis]|uniref:UDP-2,4-diacetamido-2,4,6-trideoxy-beta-L-altropy ranose hydrolase n=1 Tax=Thiomicrorhabdus immobilis TaxID=2791037 RepID=A0ABM7MBK4_9GAMM|nr:UDP-2,4-diacetamido-2,4,6-trideoxy-beta-L-altropyranose hydrolase [Thiomicrorhabdus immobilis]BCN92694.1 UDP-2,4-diacetamido-2,4,6-trideoxy-beta-L-altropy ranose hydrolase [Thiomicrorhabdus immobilis]
MKLVFRTDASITIGTGHVMRCLTLAKALAKKGADVQFICRDHVGNLIAKIRQEGFIVRTLNTRSSHSEQTESKEAPRLFHSEWLGVTQQQDANDCHSILEAIQPDWLVVDHYAIDQAWQKALKPNYQNLMVIDDLGDRQHICDLLLDQNYGATADKYQSLVPEHCKILAGAQYALLRPEFAKWRQVSLKRREYEQKVKSILITLGGVDPDNYTGKILHQLAKTELDPNLEITVIMGATAPHFETVKQQAESMNVKTRVKTNVINMAELMANADLAIGAAGATTWERCCLGLPTIQLVIADNQRQIAQALAKDNAIKLLVNIQELPGLVKTAKDWKSAVFHTCKNLTDGLGCQKVIELIR